VRDENRLYQQNHSFVTSQTEGVIPVGTNDFEKKEMPLTSEDQIFIGCPTPGVAQKDLSSKIDFHL
jgi:hypothetical protein